MLSVYWPVHDCTEDHLNSMCKSVSLCLDAFCKKQHHLGKEEVSAEVTKGDFNPLLSPVTSVPWFLAGVHMCLLLEMPVTLK